MFALILSRARRRHLPPARGVFALAKSRKVFAELFAKKATSRFAHKVATQPVVPAGTRRFLCRIACDSCFHFAPFVSKESGVPNYALQNR
ncbi:MAG: hypothetical protein IJW79_03865, partial [Clostridia bacterium]|nr:hypothetical protein [Clostridia bacterium]